MQIKELDSSHHSILEEFCYWAIFTPPGAALPDRDIIFHPTVHTYIEHFGNGDGCGVFAEIDGKAVGAAWARTISAFGYIDDETPELCISVLPEYRSQGIGGMLMVSLFELLRKHGYTQTSLAVQKENHSAIGFYRRLGYEIVGEKTEEYLMLKKLVDKV